jgi:hypothetical protein
MKTSNATIFRFILDSQDYEGYKTPVPETDKDKAQFIYDRFQSEYGFFINRDGEFHALQEWLAGLALNIPYTNNDILQLAIEWGGLKENATDAQEWKIIENYFRFMAQKIVLMWLHYKTVRNIRAA